MTPSERARLIEIGTQAAYQKLDELDLMVLAELERLYTTVAHQLAQKLEQYSLNGYFADTNLRPLLTALNAFLEQLAQKREDLINRTLAQAAEAGALPAAWIGVSSTAIDLSIAHSVQAVWKLELADGLQLSERLWKLDKNAKTEIVKALRQSIAMGQNPMEGARELLRTAQLKGRLEELLTGKGSALYNAQRVFQTENKRAHALAYINSNDGTPALLGFRYKLSPLHRRVDICDQHATANQYGLGAGIYPANIIRKIFPAHPNTRSSIVAVYKKS